jgi:septal ring factor EnvC (AmiA/AmiB activator)
LFYWLYMTIKRKRKNQDKVLIEEFKQIKSYQAELEKLEAHLKEIETKLMDMIRQMNESKEKDKELRKNIEILARKMQKRW